MLRRLRNPATLASRHLLPDTASEVAAARPDGRPDHRRRAHPSAMRARPAQRGAGHDRWMEGAGRRSPDQPVLRIPPQPRDLVALRLDLHVPARVAPPTTGSSVYALSWERSPTTHRSSRASRRSTGDAVCWRTGRRPRRLDGRPTISSGRATSSASSTSSAPWCNPTSIASRVRSRGSSRSARP
jgi:hypothetical protein